MSRTAPLRELGLAVLILAALGCQLDSELPIETHSEELLGGAVAGPGDDPAVVALANSFGPFCTGTLVTPRAVLTAAHCIDAFDPANPQVGIFFGSDIDSGGRVSAIGGAVMPGWDGQVGFDKPTDVGLLILKSAQLSVAPLPMNRRAPIQGESYRHVGFGVFDNSMPSDGRKRQGTITISSVGQGIIESGTAQLSICFGDSGGPGFVQDEEGVEYVAGVHSFTSTQNGGCRAPAGDSRVDVALDWVQPWLDDNDPSCGPDGVCAGLGCTSDPDCDKCGADGQCVICETEDPDCPSKATGDACQQAAECGGGSCLVWDRDLSSRFCSEPCTSDDACPDGMSCRQLSDGRQCYWDDPPPGRLGSACETGSDCFSQICDGNQCTVTCNLGVGLTCPNGFTCEGNEANGFFCRGEAVGDEPGDGGGCQAAPSSRGALLWIALLAALSILRRRRPTAAI